MKKLQVHLIAVIGTLLLILGAGLSLILLNHNERMTRNNILNLVAADNSQMTVNVENYLQTVKSTAALMFSDQACYSFDPTDQRMEEYDRIQGKSAIEDRIVDIALQQNYSDFGVVYADDSTVGWISQETKGTFPQGGMYETFASCITDEQNQEGWAFGIKGNQDRIWYLKRLNPHAVLVVSFYSHELNRIFRVPDELQPMTVRLVNGDKRILYSSDEEEIGQTLQEGQDIAQKDGQSASGYGKDSLLSGDYLFNGWRLVSWLPLDQINRQDKVVRRTVLLLLVGFLTIFLLILTLLWKRMSDPVSALVKSLNVKASQDQLTGLLNKVTYELLVQENLASGRKTGSYVYMMMDIDNFKHVNDTYGHEMGDQVIRICGQTLRDLLPANTVVGRIGGDEFSAFRCTEEGPEEVAERARKLAWDIENRIQQETYEKSGGRVSGSVSIGIVVTSSWKEKAFHDLYMAADKSLYQVKKSGKGAVSVSIWEEEDHV